MPGESNGLIEAAIYLRKERHERKKRSGDFSG
jgi:hypothetical protein